MLVLERCDFGIGRRQDVVIAVAVVTGGDFRGDVGTAQRHGLAVVGVPVMRQAVCDDICRTARR